MDDCAWLKRLGCLWQHRGSFSQSASRVEGGEYMDDAKTNYTPTAWHTVRMVVDENNYPTHRVGVWVDIRAWQGCEHKEYYKQGKSPDYNIKTFMGAHLPMCVQGGGAGVEYESKSQLFHSAWATLRMGLCPHGVGRIQLTVDGMGSGWVIGLCAYSGIAAGS